MAEEDQRSNYERAVELADHASTDAQTYALLAIADQLRWLQRSIDGLRNTITTEGQTARWAPPPRS